MDAKGRSWCGRVDYFILLFSFNFWEPLSPVAVYAWTYHFENPALMTWDEAERFCTTHFTNLVAIQNKEEIAYLNKTVPYNKSYYWIGIRKRNGVWTWIGTNKTLTEEAKNWASREPNNRGRNQDCVEFYIKRPVESGKWNDEPCTKKKRSLCYQASCQPSSCNEHSECVETIGSFRCQCHPGFVDPDCSAVQCQPLHIPADGNLSCTHVHGEFKYQSSCNFQCAEGFLLNGSETTMCQASGNWSSLEPTCQAVECPKLNAPENGELNCSHSHGNFTYQSSCHFSCHRGFKKVGTEQTQCTALGRWTENPPVCEVMRCHSLQPPTDGKIECSHPAENFSYRSSCEFACDPGFALEGKNTTNCLETGHWSVPVPTCKAIECPKLEAPENGDLNCRHLHGDFAWGSSCSFSCHAGFLRIGKDQLQCSSRGTWTDKAPFCKAVTCPTLNKPDYGHLRCLHLHGDFAYGSRCNFSCGDGFLLDGLETLDCIVQGQWTHEPPSCKAVKCPLLNKPENGDLSCHHLHGDFMYSSRCTFSCNDGFNLDGEKDLRCTAWGNWTEEPPRCKAVKCPTLNKPDYGHLRCLHLHGDFVYGSKCNFSCGDGFLLDGLETLDCTVQGQWTHEPPTCKATKCPLLNKPENGDLSCHHLHGDFTYSSSCTFSCNDGFNLDGEKDLSCTAWGNWTEEPPRCKAIKCPLLKDMKNMYCSHPLGSFSYKSTCCFNCTEGYSLNGTSKIWCQSDGRWSAEIPVCQENAASYLKQSLLYVGAAAASVVGMILSGSLIILAARHLNRREEKKLLPHHSDLGSAGVFSNAGFASTY